jgi:predicted nucleic acid-binding protein
MILADSSIWIEHLRRRLPQMDALLQAGSIVMHPYIVAELALGSLNERAAFLAELDRLLKVNVAQTSEVRGMIEAHALYGKGIGFVDAHLLASCLLTQGTRLWTRDAALSRAAREFGINADLPHTGRVAQVTSEA